MSTPLAKAFDPYRVTRHVFYPLLAGGLGREVRTVELEEVRRIYELTGIWGGPDKIIGQDFSDRIHVGFC